MNILRRIAPAVTLFFLSPLIAEWLLGDLNAGQFGALIALAPLYGGGAILIREILKRARRGWPSFILLGLAYALIEEGLATQSLFNPNYLHLRLLDYGFIPVLGTSLAWSIYVLTIHIVWSLAVPIGLTESLFPARREEPWLGRIGFAAAALFYLAGLAMVNTFSLGQSPFRASPLQLGTVALLAITCIAAALLLVPRTTPKRTSAGNSLAYLTGGALIAGSAFLLTYSLGPGTFHLHWLATVGLLLFLILAGVAFVAIAARGASWSPRQIWAAAFGAMLCYAWFGYSVDRALHGPHDAAQHSIFVLLCVLIGGIAGLRAHHGDSSQPVAAVSPPLGEAS